MSLECEHAEYAQEAVELTADARERPTAVILCGWADAFPAALVDAPRWVQRHAIAGGMMQYPADCVGCPAFKERTRG